MAISSFIPAIWRRGGSNRNLAANRILEVDGTTSEQTFKHLLRVVLNDADGNEASLGGTLTEADWLFASLAAAAVLVGFSPVLGDSTTEKTLITISNLTNADITYSFDNSNDHGIVAAGHVASLDLGANGRYQVDDIYVKYSSSAPTAGAVYVTAMV